MRRSRSVTPLRKLRRESLGFAIGSVCFALGALPGYSRLVGEGADNVTYFVGSLFFTAAAFIQLRLSGRWRRGAWKSREDWDDWWAAAVQFAGTLLFNVSTGTALYEHLSAEQAHDHVWRPDAFGSACFLLASALAIQATTHREGLWDPDARNWWSTWLNMAGSMPSPPRPSPPTSSRPPASSSTPSWSTSAPSWAPSASSSPPCWCAPGSRG